MKESLYAPNSILFLNVVDAYKVNFAFKFYLPPITLIE